MSNNLICLLDWLPSMLRRQTYQRLILSHFFTIERCCFYFLCSTKIFIYLFFAHRDSQMVILLDSTVANINGTLWNIHNRWDVDRDETTNEEWQVRQTRQHIIGKIGCDGHDVLIWGGITLYKNNTARVREGKKRMILLLLKNR